MQKYYLLFLVSLLNLIAITKQFTMHTVYCIAICIVTKAYITACIINGKQVICIAVRKLDNTWKEM